MGLAAARVLFGLFGLVAGSAIPLSGLYAIWFVRQRGASWRTWGALVLRLLALAVGGFVLLGMLSLAAIAAGGGMSSEPTAQQVFLDDTVAGQVGLLGMVVGFVGGILAVGFAIRAASRRSKANAGPTP